MDTETYRWLVEQVRKAEVLEKYAAQDPDMLATKTQLDRDLLDHIKKTAAGLLSRAAAHPLGKGLMLGTGVALPVGLAGSHLIGRVGQEKRDTIEDVRNKALQVAAGLGLIGGGAMAAHRLTQPPAEKRGSAENEELLEKLATVGYLDEVFEDQMKNAASTEVRVQAERCHMLNAEHGIDILKQILS